MIRRTTDRPHQPGSGHCRTRHGPGSPGRARYRSSRQVGTIGMAMGYSGRSSDRWRRGRNIGSAPSADRRRHHDHLCDMLSRAGGPHRRRTAPPRVRPPRQWLPSGGFGGPHGRGAGRHHCGLGRCGRCRRTSCLPVRSAGRRWPGPAARGRGRMGGCDDRQNDPAHPEPSRMGFHRRRP